MAAIASLARPLAPAFYPSAFFNRAVLNALDHLPTSYSLGGLQSWYTHADPLHPALLFCAVMSFLVWLVGEATGNVSQVDRLWTFLPVAYSVHFTFFPVWSGTGELDQRMLLVLGLQLLWSARLTRNTYIRGFFNPSTEDYRWEVQKQKMSWIQWKLLNIYFISIMQNMLLAVAQLPQYLLLTLTPAYSPKFVSPPLGVYDGALAALFVVILVLETVADVQQQNYQSFKAEAKKSGRKLSPKEQGQLTRGFITSGLWGYSRHPNFACEQSTWYVLYAFTIVPFLAVNTLTVESVTNAVLSVTSFADVLALGRALQGTLWNYSIWAPLTMTMLFYGSTDLTEEISNQKYPLYKQYQKRVAQFWGPGQTTLKGIYLFIVGQRAIVDDLVFGSAAAAKKQK